ncbi:uncharacterized protein APUU_60803A [Aspergillus puulaauensis]|uniref:Transferase family-domain-containing protein n=1 Tax=Aspergillus puulaauensis TaxID=1220207 RepID=A0A7R7XU49_9EURO|nr:uncharacterized protein APUU_60803A [Aspergillus puulaauensis]BCS27755.1 hypothetical protein APUU_60803A [Aspergillus puulaauensis]
MANPLAPIALTPLDHTLPKFYLPYMLYFNTPDTKTALQTVHDGVKKLVSHLPWLAGDVTYSSKPCGPQNRGHIVAPSGPLEAVPMLHVKSFNHDDESHTLPINSYLPLPCFIPPSQQRPVVRFQANVFPNRIILVMSFLHFALDGTGAGVILRALAECCNAKSAPNATGMAITTTSVAENEINLRNQISSWPSRCNTLVSTQSLELATPFFDPNITSEKWAAMEAAMFSGVKTRRFTFSPEKIALLKQTCSSKFLQRLSPSGFISSNDIVTAVLGITVDRAQDPSKARRKNDENARLTLTVDLRSRVQPPLPSTFVGNMNYPAYCEIQHLVQDNNNNKEEEADLLALTQLALQLRGKLSSMNESVAYSVSAAVADLEDWSNIESKPGNVIVTTWRHLDSYALDFGNGLGKIVDFEAGLSLIPGACIIMPAREKAQKEKEGEGKGEAEAVPWEVNITMKLGDMDVLVGDPLLARILA